MNPSVVRSTKGASRLLVLAAACSVAGLADAADQPWWQDVGFIELRNELASSTPTGVGIRVGIADPTGYPTANATQSGVTVTPIGTTTPYQGDHANSCSRFLYGDLALTNANNNGVGTGISEAFGATSGGYISSYIRGGLVPSSTWLPAGAPIRVWSHSYISSSYDNQYFRNADYTVTRDQYSNVIGVQNDNGLWGACYNTINVTEVGAAGQNTVVQGTYDGAGRYAAHLTAPGVYTSDAVPMVGAVAAAMWQQAGDPANPANRLRKAANPETIKAVLMAGATKDEADFGAAWQHSQTHPLDPVYGAGEVNVFNSYHILDAGQQPKGSGTTAAKRGWDYSTVSTGTPSTYYFEIGDNETVSNLSIILNWNRLITPRTVSGSDSWDIPLWYLANLDLKLYTANGDQLGSLVDQSVSWLYNTEHVYVPGELGPGRYAIQVLQLNAANSDTPDTTYSIAWSGDVTLVPEPTGVTLIALGICALLLRPR